MCQSYREKGRDAAKERPWKRTKKVTVKPRLIEQTSHWDYIDMKPGVAHLFSPESVKSARACAYSRRLAAEVVHAASFFFFFLVA